MEVREYEFSMVQYIDKLLGDLKFHRKIEQVTKVLYYISQGI